MPVINVSIFVGDLIAYEKEHSVSKLTETEEMLLETLTDKGISYDDYNADADEDGITISIDNNISIYAHLTNREEF